ncbi:MAG: LemA family protein [Lentisphaeria bacterium]|nr:LemA family protein [Lentisphaeria bacterium]
MANPLDEVTGPYNDEGREARVIEKQLPVTIGIGSAIFEIAIWLVGFIPGAVISFAVKPNLEPWIIVLIWCAGILPGLIYLLLKVQAKNYFNQLQQRIQASASTIGNYQEQRYEILKNVAGLVKQSIDLDKEVMTAVAAYRGGMKPDGGSLSADAETLDRGFARLFPQVEAYPELKAHAQIAEAMRQNSYLQREITAARDLYNQVVLVWNTDVFEWPVKQIVAARAHYTTRIPFTVSKAVIEGSKGTFF